MKANAKAKAKGKAIKNRKVDESDKPIIDVSKLVRFAEPKYELDITRSQYLGRTGFRGPAQSASFTFGGAKPKYANKSAALAAAKKWVVLERARQGLTAL